jgi:hypothetical protein
VDIGSGSTRGSGSVGLERVRCGFLVALLAHAPSDLELIVAFL